MHSVQANFPIENSEILYFFLHGIQALEKHITDSLILKPLWFNLGDLIQPHGADGLNGRLSLGELPDAGLAAGAVDRVIGQEGLVEVHQGTELFQPVRIVIDQEAPVAPILYLNYI